MAHHGVFGERLATVGALCVSAGCGRARHPQGEAVKRCNCCQSPVAITPNSRVRPWVTTFIYMLMWECACGSTLAITMWETADH